MYLEIETFRVFTHFNYMKPHQLTVYRLTDEHRCIFTLTAVFRVHAMVFYYVAVVFHYVAVVFHNVAVVFHNVAVLFHNVAVLFHNVAVVFVYD